MVICPTPLVRLWFMGDPITIFPSGEGFSGHAVIKQKRKVSAAGELERSTSIKTSIPCMTQSRHKGVLILHIYFHVNDYLHVASSRRLQAPVSSQSDHKIQWTHFLFLPALLLHLPTAPMIAQHNQQSKSVETDCVTVNTTGNTFAGKPIVLITELPTHVMKQAQLHNHPLELP